MNSENNHSTDEPSVTTDRRTITRAVGAIAITITALSILAVRGMQQSLDKIYAADKGASRAVKLDQNQTAAVLALDTAMPVIVRGNPTRGKSFFNMSCFVCHGPTGAGTPGLGPSLRESRFVANHADEQLMEFIKKGREPNDPNSILHLTMPPKGGNPTLDDKGLLDVVSFVRTLQSTGR